MWRNGKRFPCPDCHKTFATQVDLKAHLMRHITQHPYVCFACGKGFKYDHTLDFHIKSQHGAENGGSSGGGAGGSGNNAGTGNCKNELFNLKSLNRKGCKIKREVSEEKANIFGTSSVGGSRRDTSQLPGAISSPDDVINNVTNNVPVNNSHNSATFMGGKTNSCDDRVMIGSEISRDLRHHLTNNNNPLQLAGLNLSSGPAGLGLLEPSILNGLKFPITLSSYPSASSSNSSQSSSKSNNTVPIVPPILPSTASSSSSLISTSLASSSLTSSLLTTTPPSSQVSSLTLSSSSSSTPTSIINKEKLMNSSQMPSIDFGLQGDVLSPRNLQIKSEKVLISILEGVHPINDQLYSLYKCCLCGFAFPSLEPVSIHIQSMHSNNSNLTCDKCGATFKWKSELQLHEQLHKVMGQSINSMNTSSNKCKSQLQVPHHSHINQQHQRDHLLQNQHQQQNQQQPQQQQQQQQQQSRSLVMPSFLQPNLVFMNPYLSGDQQLISKGSEETKRAKVKIESEEEVNGREDDGQGLNLCLKRKHKSEIRDANNNNNLNHDNNNNDNTIKHNGINYDNENNINNCNAHDNINNNSDSNNGHDGISSMMDEPIDLKVDSLFADSNNNINNITPINPLSFLHSSLLPASVGLSFPPSTATQLTSAAAAAAAAFAAGISSHQSQHPKNKQLHQQFQSIASMVSGISTMTTINSGGSASTSGIGLGSGSGSVSSSSSSGSVNGHGFGSVMTGNVAEGVVSKIREPIGDIEETAPGQFKCRYCEKTFDRIFSVHRHERVHTGYKPCICRVCGRGFSEKRNLRHHIIRFHSDGSGRELLKRVRKEKSISTASFLKKAAVRLLSNSSLDGSAMEEEEDSSAKPSDKNNNIDSPPSSDHVKVNETTKEELMADQESQSRFNEYSSANTATKAGYKESNNNIADYHDDKEIGSDANGEYNAEEGDKVCANLSSSSSSRRRKSKPSKKITNLESGVKSDEEAESSENVENQYRKKDERDERIENKSEDEEGDCDTDRERERERERERGKDRGEEREEGVNDGSLYKDRVTNGIEDEEEEDDDQTGGDSMVADYCDQGDDSNDQNDANCRVTVKKERDDGTEDERERDCADNTRNGKNDLNGPSYGNKCSDEGKSRLHGAFFSNYSPRLALVDKVLKRSKQSKPMVGPDGRYLYPCDHCQKTFCSSSDLNRHIGFHENIRPFKCEFCDYQSRTNSQLKVHVMRHAGIKQYLCHTCNYNGVTQSDLNRHRKTQSHKSRSGNICSLCSLGFSTQTLLEDHILKFHGNNDKNNNQINTSQIESTPSLQECKVGSPSSSSSSSPPSATLSGGSKEEMTGLSSTATPPFSMPPTISETSNEMDNNNNINHINVLGLNANRFSVNNLL